MFSLLTRKEKPGNKMMMFQDLSFSKPLNPSLFPLKPKPHSLSPPFSFSLQNPKTQASLRRNTRSFAGRSKKTSEGNSDFRRGFKQKTKQKSINIADSPFYRLKNPNKNYPDNFTEDELSLIGLGYDRMVRFMEKDDPNLRHPYDWYKYGEFGPYSWRGVVIGEPIRGRFSDECVTLYSEVKDHEEFEKIEQFEMEVDYGERLKQLDKNVGFRHYWVFVRHPKWRISEQPWEQWSLVSEVVVEASKKERLDKWSLMGRLGNKARKLITQCAAWFRPDIIYVKRPVFQCRFEPQEDFFRALTPYLDPKTERDFMVELRSEDGRVELCTYYEGLCKIVKVSQKAFVDDVVNAYMKLSDEKKSWCLDFLLRNHPVQLLHPYTKEWKAKLEEMELGCDAPDDDEGFGKKDETMQFTEWIEDDGDGNDDEEDNVVLDMEDGGDEDTELRSEAEDYSEEEEDEEEDEQYWEKKFQKALSSAEEMENLARMSIEMNTKLYNNQLNAMEAEEKRKNGDLEDGDESAMRGKASKVSPEERKTVGIGRWRKRIKKSKIPPELFLRAAVRPFTYRNLVKEIVLTRHAILDGDIGRKE